MATSMLVTDVGDEMRWRQLKNYSKDQITRFYNYSTAKHLLVIHEAAIKGKNHLSFTEQIKIIKRR